MHALNRWTFCSLCFALALPVFAAGPALVVDRGLPQGNLNKAAGQFRSNIRWTMYDNGFLGDDFTIGAPGENWVVDAIRVWTVPGVNKKNPDYLGDFYQDVRLYFGAAQGGLSPIVTGTLTAGSNQSSNSNILISDITAAGSPAYQNFRTNMQVWQIDFTQLNLPVQGGEKYRFGAWGLGRTAPNAVARDGRIRTNHQTYAWFNAASNAEYAAAKQDGSDGSMLEFTSGGKFKTAFNGAGKGWDKGSDINVQVFAHRVN